MKKTLSTLLLVSLLAPAAQAQEAPAPRRMPRTPVSQEVLAGSRDPMPAARQMQGLAAIIDGEKMRIGETDLRLFGIVPPQLAASFGPQARTELDTLANGQNVTCQIRDRDRDGRLLATCRNAKDSDMALELLKHGLAVTARGSIASTELSAPYLAAEQAAQNQKIGLWSVLVATPVPAVAAPAAPMPAKQESAPALTEDKPAAHSDKAPTADTQLQAKIAASVVAQQTQARLDDEVWTPGDNVGFFERYQILISGLLMLATALGITGALWMQKNRDRCEEIKAVAAALRGELMAARGVCLGRAKSIADDADDSTINWPRIRTTLYQAYVGRLGVLGAELARQVASLYGQTSDYAALHTTNGTPAEVSKKQALTTLAKRIDEVLPKLAEIEATGQLTGKAPLSPRITRPRPATSTAAQQPASSPAAPESSAPNAAVAEEEHYAPAPEAQSPLSGLSPLAMWEAVRIFIQSHRAPAAEEQQPQPPIDPAIAEYAAIIEADMARYQYSESTESLDISPQKKKV